jgi:hypothetical protein
LELQLEGLGDSMDGLKIDAAVEQLTGSALKGDVFVPCRDWILAESLALANALRASNSFSDFKIFIPVPSIAVGGNCEVFDHFFKWSAVLDPAA